MKGYALLILSLTAGLILFIALITPGWVGFEVDKSEYDAEISMSIFYTKACVTSDVSGTVVCETMSSFEALTKHLSASTSLLDTVTEFRFTAFTIEASFALMGVVIGTVLTIISSVLVIKSERRNIPPPSMFNGLSATALTFIITGGFCGGIICIEFIRAHNILDDAFALFEIETQEPNAVQKLFPYSLLLMSFGIFFEFIAVCVHIACLISPIRSEQGIVLTPAVNAPTVVVQNSTSTSSMPYTTFS